MQSFEKEVSKVHNQSDTVPAQRSALFACCCARSGARCTPKVQGNPAERLAALRQASKLPAQARTNRLPARVQSNLATDVIWLLDADGDCIAASNVNQADSFVGNNFREREYYASAKLGVDGYQFAVGKVSKKPGLYFSAPVLDKARVIGVVVAKVDIAHLAQDIDLNSTFIMDDNGVVILAHDKRMEMKALASGTIHTRAPDARRRMYQRESFPILQIEPWPGQSYPMLSKLEQSDVPWVMGHAKLLDDHLQIMVAWPLPELRTLDARQPGISEPDRL